MKLRTRGNSLRLRLTQSEVKQFVSTGTVEEEVRFSAEHALKYRMVTSRLFRSVKARFEDNTITLEVPEKIAQQWASTEEVAFHAVQELSEKDSLKILVEKDFACLKPRSEEDESDNFPNPNSSCS